MDHDEIASTVSPPGNFTVFDGAEDVADAGVAAAKDNGERA